MSSLKDVPSGDRLSPAEDAERRACAWQSRPRILVFVLAALAAAGAAAQVASEQTVSIVRPPAGTPLFDQVDVALEVDAGARVELLLDGRSVGILDAPPYEMRIDVGSENRNRRLEVIVRGTDGEVVARTAASYPAVVVHDEVDLGLRQLYVMVSDRKGERVLGLEHGDFTVYDEGRPQKLVTFEGGDIPFTAVLLLDGSGSMRGGRLELALAGARSFVDGMREYDEARVVVYSDRILEATAWHGPDSAAVLDATAEAQGGTAVLDHLYLGLHMLEERQGRRVLVLLSDGWDLQSVLDVDQLEEAARRSEAILYWVRRSDEGPEIELRCAAHHHRYGPLTSWRDKRKLRRVWQRLERIVRRSGGRVVRIAGVNEVEAPFREILRELREQYALGYYPDPKRHDGAWRQVEVSVKYQGARVRAREGYVDE